MTPKKRRIALTPAPLAAPVHQCQLDCHPTVELGDGVAATLTLPHAQVEVAHSADQFCQLLHREAAAALATHEQWARSPHATWIQTLAAELGAEARRSLLEKQRLLQGADDFAARWEAGAELASKAVELWLAEAGRTLEQVLAKSGSLGHAQLRSGLVLTGRFVNEVALSQDVDAAQLLPWLSRLAKADGTASLYRVDPANAFATLSGRDSCPLGELPAALASGAPIGSLNTTWAFDEDDAPSSGVPLLDGYHAALDEAMYASEPRHVRLNPRLFLIWKTQGYCTPYHQDTHVPPHLTLHPYNQASGASAFHFLPLLVGLHAAHVGHAHGPRALAQLLAELQRRGVGETATLGPGQLLLILPAGAHGVFVPRAATNSPAVGPFEVSLIRAAEIFCWGLYELFEKRAAAATWASPFTLTAAELEEEAGRAAAFEERQQAVCKELGLSPEQWFAAARQLWTKWEEREDEGEEGLARGLA